jgi:hypothetical protein
MDEFELLSKDDFLAAVHANHENSEEELDAMCDNCDVPMNISGNDYVCENCGKKTPAGNWDSSGPSSNGGVVRFGGAGVNSKKTLYMTKTDPEKAQKNNILLQMQARYNVFSDHRGNKFPMNIIRAAVDDYVAILNAVPADESCAAKSHRRSLKNEMLAGLLKIEMQKMGNVMPDAEIARFMELQTGGFSKGTGLLDKYRAQGLPVPSGPEDITTSHLNTYLPQLGIDTPTHRMFVTDVVTRSFQRKIAMQSYHSSKIIGAIWILIERCKLGITAHALEKCTGGTKKSTFCKFTYEVYRNISSFCDIFEKYGVPVS